ncbi:LOW QUALITY PROTEIN: kelch-like protein 18 [Pollicipes pollicipes]|uniref:LOW QUALITY PROTEIN: kelch-like protein 18 n=1 Tax=Pollicipes pollicipes TaxID=41117 RepID=UPI0018856CF9|nr:LOW QUALITY PROTEIN: kelch-like protein 18 [Pollicipes pollicipes]
MAASRDHTIFVQSDLFEKGFPVMEEIRRKGKLCDVTLKVDGQSFTAHKLVLSANIPYFNAMFLHDMVESKLSEIEMKEIDTSALESLINFAYSGRILINNSNVQNLMMGAAFLQLTAVRDACAKHLIKELAPGNALGIRKFGCDLHCTALVKAADAYIQKRFGAVTEGDEFLQLEERELRDIISRDELHVESEELVFEAVLRWVKHDTEQRPECLAGLLTLVRMPLLTPQYLTDHVATEPLIRSSHLCRDLLDEARDYMLMPERRAAMRSFTSRPRCCIDIVGLMYAVGGLAKSGGSLSTVEVFHPVTGRWTMAEKMSGNRSRVGVATMNGRLYAIGGFNGTDRLATVEVFDPRSRTWEEAKPMNYRRSALGAVTLNHEIYVCGGYDGSTSLNSVEKYDSKLNRWTPVTSMIRQRSAAGVVAFEGKIFVLGGHDGLSIFETVECYDPQKGVWCCGPPMLTKRCRLGAAALNGKLYVCGGYDGSVFLRTVEAYDPVTNSWSYVAPMNVTRSRVSLVAVMGRLYGIGGYDGFANLSTVEVYDPQRDCWEPAASMCAHEGGVGVGVIPVLE